MKLQFPVILLLSLVTTSNWADDVYVSPRGNDGNPGIEAAPVSSIDMARKLVRQFSGKEAVTVHVADGIYYLPDPLVFTPEDSGTEDAPVVFQADHEGGAVLSGGTQLNLQWQPYREGIFQAEWFHDAEKNILYYMPEPSLDLRNATTEVVRLRQLVEFRGTEATPVKYVKLKGFSVRHAARTFMETKEPLLRSDWAIYRGGAFFLTGTENIQVLNCEFDQVGGNAIFASNYNRQLLVNGCHIHDCGASGVCFVGDPDALRNPLFEYGQRNDLSTIDRTPGPKTNNYPADCAVALKSVQRFGRTTAASDSHSQSKADQHSPRRLHLGCG